MPTKASWDTSGYAYFSGVPTTNPAINFDGKNHAIICSKCHRLESFDTGFKDERAPALENWKLPSGVATDTVTGFINPSAIGGSNVAHGQHHYDHNDGSPQCVNCHIAIPHGWKRPRLIVNSGPGVWADNTHVAPADEPPYRSPNQFGVSDAVASFGGVTGGPWWGMEAFGNQPLPPADRVDDHDVARVGMQSISGTDEHELILSAPGDGTRGPFTGMNDNFIEWTEYKCGACDFHHPYSDPRVSDPVGVGGDTIIVKE